MRTMLARINGHAGEEVCVQGWVHRIRELGKISFILLRDASGMAQLVVDAASAAEEVARTSAELTLESVVSVRGTVAENAKAPGGYEVQVSRLDVIARAEADLPLAVNQDPGKELESPSMSAFSVDAATCIGEEGGTLTNGFVTLVIPPGAVVHDTDITIRMLDEVQFIFELMNHD